MYRPIHTPNLQELAELMAYTAESIVFGYFGLTAVAYTSQVAGKPLDVSGGGREILMRCEVNQCLFMLSYGEFI
jgi:hypothetical protein